MESSKFICFKSSTLNILSTNKVTCRGLHFFHMPDKKTHFLEYSEMFSHKQFHTPLPFPPFLHEKVSTGPIPDAETLPRACFMSKPSTCWDCFHCSCSCVYVKRLAAFCNWLFKLQFARAAFRVRALVALM